MHSPIARLSFHDLQKHVTAVGARRLLWVVLRRCGPSVARRLLKQGTRILCRSIWLVTLRLCRSQLRKKTEPRQPRNARWTEVLPISKSLSTLRSPMATEACLRQLNRAFVSRAVERLGAGPGRHQGGLCHLRGQTQKRLSPIRHGKSKPVQHHKRQHRNPHAIQQCST